MHDYRFLIRPEWPWSIREAIRKAGKGDGDLDERALACVRMFRAVICRSIADAYGKTGLEDQSERRNAIREAREFFHRQDEDFTLVFSCAGIDPVPILAHMLTLSPEEYQKPLDSGGNSDHVVAISERNPKE